MKCTTMMVWLVLQPLLASVGAISMTPDSYRRLVAPRCFNRTSLHMPLTLGQHKPIGMSIDYFISLLEIIESKLSHLDTKQVLVLLLTRFHYDGFNFVGSENVQSFTEMFRRTVNNRLFEKVFPPFAQLRFPEEILTEDEKCAMFYMISHAVNSTLIQKDYRFGPTEDAIPIVREFGVITVQNSPNVAISLNSVLLGIATALLDVQPPSESPSGLHLYEPHIDPLLAVTLSDKLAISAIKSVRNVDLQALIGSEGFWNSTYCQTEYRLNSDGTVVTLAEINGAIDGWSIGRKLQTKGAEYLRALKLSTLLQRYYTKDGLAPDCGICYLDYLSGTAIDEIRETAKNYAFLWNNDFGNDVYENNLLMAYVEANWLIFNQYLQKSKSLKSRECFRISAIDVSNAQCETTSDVYVMIDNNNIYRRGSFQLEFVTQLLSRLQSLNFLGQIYLLTNAHRGYDSDVQYRSDDLLQSNDAMQIPLHMLAYNTSSAQKATCRLAWYNYRESTIRSQKNLLKFLVRLFEHSNSSGTNSENRPKNFVWFSLDTSVPNERLDHRDRVEFYRFKWYLKYFLNVRTLFISSQKRNTNNELYKMMLNQDDWFQVNADNAFDVNIVNNLAKRMCETPIPLNYDQCYNATSHDVSTANRITVSKRQYWVLYPKYFLRSELITLKFKSDSGRLRVCLDRWLHPESKSIRCKESDTEPAEFRIENPCKWKTMESCLPIYFTLTLNSYDHLPSNTCFETDCKSFDQQTWTVWHSGLFCVNSSSPLATCNQYLIALLLLYCVFNWNLKL